MSGFARTYFAAMAALASFMAKRKQDSANRWVARAERWRAKAKAQPTDRSFI